MSSRELKILESIYYVK